MIRGLFVGLLLSANLLAQDVTVTVTWDANSEADLAGYKLYYGTQSRNYAQTVDLGNQTSVEITDMARGTTYFIAVTAYDQSGNESDFSQEVSVTIPEAKDTDPPNAPVNVRVQITSD